MVEEHNVGKTQEDANTDSAEACESVSDIKMVGLGENVVEAFEEPKNQHVEECNVYAEQ